jgi:superkiller protein 3
VNLWRYILKSAMKTTLVLFLFVIANSFLFAQNSSSSEIDSLITEGNYLAALEKAKQLIEKDSTNGNAWILLGKTNRLNQRYTDAIFAYEKAKELNPDDKKLLLILAKTYSQSGNRVKAVKTYEQALQLDSTNTAIQINLSALYLKQSKYKKAYTLFEQLHKQDTLNSEYVRQMGYCMQKNDELLKAFELYKKSYELNNKNLKTIIWLANIYANSQEYDTATTILDSAIISFPDNGSLYASRGNVSFKRSHHYRSTTDFKKAIELDYRSPWIKKKLAQSLFAIKEYEESKKIFESLIVRDTADFQICNYLGNIYNEFKDYDKAILFYDYAIELLTPDPIIMSVIYRGYSNSYAGKGQYYKQIEFIKKQYEQRVLEYPRFPVYMQYPEIAEIYETKLNNKKMALKYYEKYWNVIKNDQYSKKQTELVLAKINHLKEDLHFEN